MHVPQELERLFAAVQDGTYLLIHAAGYFRKRDETPQLANACSRIECVVKLIIYRETVDSPMVCCASLRCSNFG
uniref:BTB/POZ domain-containing protein n=1 Tax=Ascaris lumbricoides TaxID=6252 RepID=A0A0M3I259_ASCLU